jgi:single-strand DNA-binding protein
VDHSFGINRKGNKLSTVSFTGNIGQNRGLKFSNEGKPRLSFSAAETARIKDQSGQWVDGGTTWFNVTLFGGAAEALDAQIAAQGGKGKVIVTGRMSTRQYESNGETRDSLDVVADSVGLVPRSESRQQGQQQPAPAAQQWGGQPAQSQGWGAGNDADPAF